MINYWSGRYKYAFQGSQYGLLEALVLYMAVGVSHPADITLIQTRPQFQYLLAVQTPSLPACPI